MNILDNNLFFKSILNSILSKKLSNTERDIFLTNISYSPGNAEFNNSIYAGIEYIKRLRLKGNSNPVIFYGFDNNEQLKSKEGASLLNSEGIFYVQMPFSIIGLFKIMENAAVSCRQLGGPLDEITRQSEIIKLLRVINHNLKNLIGTIEPNINSLKNADRIKLQREWKVMKKAILMAGEGRIYKEINLYNEIRNILTKISGKSLADINKCFLDAEGYYKEIFAICNNSGDFSQKESNIVIEKGGKVVILVKEIKDRLEKIKDEYSKI